MLSSKLSWMASAVVIVALAPWIVSGAAPKKASEQFKNIQVLKDVPADQLIPAMQFITASLGVGCDHCHVPGNFDKDDKKPKQTARQMMQMMSAINKINFAGERKVTCYSCHRGGAEPISVPVINVNAMAPAEPPKTPASLPTGEEVLNKYLAALGGSDALVKNTTRVAKGKAIIFGTRQFPAETISKSPDRTVSITHLSDGDMSNGFNSSTGWQAIPGRPVRELSAAEIDATRLDSDFYFSHHIKDLFNTLQTAGVDNLGGHLGYVVLGKRQGLPDVKLYFDGESGLLLRMMRFEETPLGLNPVQNDYADYRDVSGVKVPYHVTTLRAGRKGEVQLDAVEQNVSVEDSRFEMPQAAVPAPK